MNWAKRKKYIQQKFMYYMRLRVLESIEMILQKQGITLNQDSKADIMKVLSDFEQDVKGEVTSW